MAMHESEPSEMPVCQLDHSERQEVYTNRADCQASSEYLAQVLPCELC